MAGRTYPLSLFYFWEQLRFASYTAMNLTRFDSGQMTEGGKFLSSRRGTPLFVGECTLIPLKYDDAAEMTARFAALRGVEGYFLAYDRRRVGPKDDPTGASLSGHTPTVTSINSTRDGLAINDLPNGLKINIGDFFSAKMDDNTWTMHTFTESQVVSGGAVTTMFVEPFLPEGFDVGTQLLLYKATATFKMQIGSYSEPPNEDMFAQGYRFSWIQVFEEDI